MTGRHPSSQFSLCVVRRTRDRCAGWRQRQITLVHAVAYHDSCRLDDIDSLHCRSSNCAADTDLWCRSRRVPTKPNSSGSGSVPVCLSWATQTALSYMVHRQSSRMPSSATLLSELSWKHFVTVAAGTIKHVRLSNI